MINRSIAQIATEIPMTATISTTANSQAQFPFFDHLPFEIRAIVFLFALNEGSSANFGLADRNAPEQSTF